MGTWRTRLAQGSEEGDVLGRENRLDAPSRPGIEVPEPSSAGPCTQQQCMRW